jgi:hypothetical protein
MSETDMASDHNDTAERQARLDAMIEEFRAAQRRRIVKRSAYQGNRPAAQPPAGVDDLPHSEKLN